MLDSSEIAITFLTSLAIGLLLGIERQRRPAEKAGLRTFALVAVLGTLSGLIADLAMAIWFIPAGLLVLGLAIIAAYRNADTDSHDTGMTTIVALLLCYSLGVLIWLGEKQLAVAIAIVATVLLHFKTELHGLSGRLTATDIGSILQFGVLSLVILPLLPDQGYGPYAALNPYHIWLMVVLISGVSLIGYIALRLLGENAGLWLIGFFGGLVSSTATTFVYARQARQDQAATELSARVIIVANLVVLLRIALLTAAVAPNLLTSLLLVMGSGLIGGLIFLLLSLRRYNTPGTPLIPKISNPTDWRIALGFAALYAVVLVLAAWLATEVQDRGLYMLALISGLTDVDAITLTSLRLFNTNKILSTPAIVSVTLAVLANIALKSAVIIVIGGRKLAWRCAPSMLAVTIGLALALWWIA